MAVGEWIDLAVALQEGREQLGWPGFAVVQQEVAQVEIRVRAADLPEVDDAAVVASVRVDVGDVQIPMNQMPDTKRPLLLGFGKRTQSVQLAWAKDLSQPARPRRGLWPARW